MAETLRITQADSSIVDDINRLLKQLNADKEEVALAKIQEIVISPTAELWIVKDGEQVIGMSTINFLQRVMGSVGYVDDVVIDESHRGKGLGTKLMEAIIQSARDRGVERVALTSRPSRGAANKLYLKLGFKMKQTNAFRLKL